MKKRIYTAMMALAAAAVVAMGGGSSIDARAKWLPESYECSDKSLRGCSDNNCYCYTLMTKAQKNAVLEVVKQIVATAPASSHEKVKYFHDAICQYATYTLNPSIEIATPYGVFINRQAKCVGYAESFKMLCDVTGIPCMTVHGMINNGTTGHEWNIVQLEDGQWYEVDCTFDDTVNSQNISYKWFLVTTEQMNKDHSRGTSYSGDQSNVPVALGTQYASNIEEANTANDDRVYPYDGETVYTFTYNGDTFETMGMKDDKEMLPATLVKFSDKHKKKKSYEVPYAVNLQVYKSDNRNNLKKTIRAVEIGSINVSFKGTNIRNVVIEDQTTIGEKAFYKATKIKKITITSGTIKSVKKNAFKGMNKNATIYVPKGYVKKYTRMFRKSGMPKQVKVKEIQF